MKFTLPPLPPKADVETKGILKKAIAANKTLGELKGVVKTIPNEEILVNTLYLQEAKDSSAIENIITTHDEIYKQSLFSDFIQNPSAKEVGNYNSALWLGFELVKRHGLLTLNHIVKIQRELEQNDAGFRKLPGTELKNEQTGETVYTPPQDQATIQRLLNNLESYVNEPDDLDPLIRMAIIHYQFESIHPFYDGNGRTGRIINILYLVVNDLLDLPSLYLSRYIIRNKAEYYRLLQDVREKENWEEWILYMLDCVEKTARQTIDFIYKIKELMLEYKHKIRKESFRIYSQDLINNLFKHPYTKIEFLKNDLGVTRQTASKYLDFLAERGYLQKRAIGKTYYYVNPPLFQLITTGFH